MAISNLVAKNTLTAVENKIPSVNTLVKKQTIAQKLQELKINLNHHNRYKYITTPEFNTLAKHAFNVRLAQANLTAKTDFDAKLSSLNKKVAKNKSKHLLVESELKKLKTFDLSYFVGKSYFEEDGTPNYSVFQPLNAFFKVATNTNYVLS